MHAAGASWSADGGDGDDGRGEVPVRRREDTLPFDLDEMAARLRAAQRIINLQTEIHQLHGLLPTCSYCSRIRDQQDTWSSLEGLQSFAGSPQIREFFGKLFDGEPEVRVWVDSGWNQW